MRRKLLLTAAIATLVLGGATVVMAQTDDGDDGPLTRIGSAIQEVLDELVADDTLSQDQADAVVEALQEKRDEFRAEREALREQIEEFWSDDQLTQDELDQLPEYHPLRRLSDLMEDGSITRDELQELRPRWRGFGDH